MELDSPTDDCCDCLGVIELVSLPEPTPVVWSPHGHLAFGSGNHLIESQAVVAGKEDLEKLPESERVFFEDFDISLVMKQRALQGYSMDVRSNLS